MFYRRRGFRVVMPLLARTLGLKKKAVLRVFTPERFDTAKTLSGPSCRAAVTVALVVWYPLCAQATG